MAKSTGYMENTTEDLGLLSQFYSKIHFKNIFNI